jgi:glycosyltransferase involved in cell wall biosynthesis
VFGKTDDSSVKKLNSCINDLPKNSVDLKGFVTRDLLTEIYASVACAVFPSYQEAFSMAPMEAMAVGCPVIHTKRTSGPELINDGVEGLLVDPDNIQELVDAIIMMLTNRKRAVEMGQNGYQKIRNQFDISIIADKHIKYYMNILG